ncbi:MAG: 5-bromo-4-chloroindolyl phosphate hydrolysis family protein [Clostridia bacterium]|nr:5-bromo-4-chloroindolyl phosphate hydrolysis family protein [Clostridia bacterium]
MNAKKILKIMGYLPKWAWYLLSFSVAGPFGILGVYLTFHVLNKIVKDQKEEQAASRTGNIYKDEECTVTPDEDAHQRRQKRQHAETAPIMSENADVREVIRAGRDAMRRIRQANDIIEDEALSAQIDSIENSCAQILSILEQREQLLPQLRTFLRYYLPTTLKLLEARAKLEDSARTPKAREVRTRISDAVSAIDKAFLKQVDALDAYRFIDLESEMDVLRDMLKADGLIDEEKDDDPFAGVLGGR